jgi:hypothetical protein
VVAQTTKRHVSFLTAAVSFQARSWRGSSLVLSVSERNPDRYSIFSLTFKLPTHTQSPKFSSV